ncbi:hypothetical protein [Vulcanococcus limneticus]|uniref:hypothetical protein n=1 Tax=Vulcanococcus limneticus TaxID=2170428 RepID=UPI0018E330D3|nr:hypothetical protein [Vulcanococcus limneticus]
MRRLVSRASAIGLASVIGGISSGCVGSPIFTKEHGLNFFPEGCNRAVKSGLKDPDSYRIDKKPFVAQKTSVVTWEWTYNAKNSYGGYGDPSTVLCYINDSGAAEIFTRGDDESDLLSGRNEFLAKTNPALQEKIDKERKKRITYGLKLFNQYIEKSAKIEQDYQRRVSSICEEFRGSDPLDMPDGCPEYFETGRVPHSPD